MGKLLTFFINSNLLISFCAVAFMQSGALLLGERLLPLRPMVLVFSATFLVYNLSIFLVHLIRKKEKAAGGKMKWFRKNKKTLYALIFFNLLLLWWAAPYHSWRETIFFVHLALISLGYNIPDRYAQTAFRSIRSIPLIKIFLITYVWASIGAIYPAFFLTVLPAKLWLLFSLYFLFILAITLPFDIRDYYSDKRVRLLTIPGLIGIKRTKSLACILMLVYSLGLAFFFGAWLSAVLVFATSCILTVKASLNSPDWYFTGLVDGLLLLHFFLIV